MSDEGQRAWQLSREELEARITEQDAVIAALMAENTEVRAQVAELKARLDQNSSDSKQAAVL